MIYPQCTSLWILSVFDCWLHICACKGNCLCAWKGNHLCTWKGDCLCTWKGDCLCMWKGDCLCWTWGGIDDWCREDHQSTFTWKIQKFLLIFPACCKSVLIADHLCVWKGDCLCVWKGDCLCTWKGNHLCWCFGGDCINDCHQRGSTVNFHMENSKDLTYFSCMFILKLLIHSSQCSIFIKNSCTLTCPF